MTLTEASYGKSAVRLVTVRRESGRHELRDLTVAIALQGEFEPAHVSGDNTGMVATDTMRNTVYALAKQLPLDEPEPFAAALVAHFLAGSPLVHGARVHIAVHPWTRLGDHEHAFSAAGGGDRIAVATGARGDTPRLEGGIEGLRLLRTTGSGWSDFHRDDYTTLPDTDDRIFATSVTARWSLGTALDTDFGAPVRRRPPDAPGQLRRPLQPVGPVHAASHGHGRDRRAPRDRPDPPVAAQPAPHPVRHRPLRDGERERDLHRDARALRADRGHRGAQLMPTVAELELPRFDYTDQSLRGERYHAVMAEVAAHGEWLAEGPLGYVALDRESGEFFLRTRAAIFPGLKIAELCGISDGPLYEEIVRNIININGEDHGRLRKLLNRALTPRAADRHRPAMRAILADLFAALPADGGCEFVTDFAKPYPSLVIAHLLGIAEADAPLLHDWSNWIQRQFDAASLVDAPVRERIERSVVEYHAWAQELLARKRAQPGEDLTSELLAVDGLAEVELVNLVLDVILGGIDTAQSQLSHVVRLLAQHPAQWDALRAQPAELAASAVDEAFRYEPVTPFTARITTEPLEYRGVTFPENTVVMVSAFHANRDGVAGDGFDISPDRERGRPLTFGAGIHYCVGANIARAELQEALAFLAAHVERIELTGEPQFGTIMGIYGVDSLPLRFHRG